MQNNVSAGVVHRETEGPYSVGWAGRKQPQNAHRGCVNSSDIVWGRRWQATLCLEFGTVYRHYLIKNSNLDYK